MSMKILITGAGGLIGGFIVEEALSRGYETEHGTISFIIWELQNVKIPMTSIESTTAL